MYNEHCVTHYIRIRVSYCTVPVPYSASTVKYFKTDIQLRIYQDTDIFCYSSHAYLAYSNLKDLKMLQLPSVAMASLKPFIAANTQGPGTNHDS